MYELIVFHKDTDNKSITNLKNSINDASMYLDKVIEQIEFQRQLYKNFSEKELSEILEKFMEKLEEIFSELSDS